MRSKNSSLFFIKLLLSIFNLCEKRLFFRRQLGGTSARRRQLSVNIHLVLSADINFAVGNGWNHELHGQTSPVLRATLVGAIKRFQRERIKGIQHGRTASAYLIGRIHSPYDARARNGAVARNRGSR